jgi:hypothetical protein
MYHPASFWFGSLDVKPKKIKTVIYVGKERLFFGQIEVEFCLEEVSNFLLGLLYSGNAVIAEHDEVSGPREFHPRALSEPDMNLSAHPAPIIQP